MEAIAMSKEGNQEVNRANQSRGRAAQHRASAGGERGEPARGLVIAEAPSPIGAILFALQGDALCALYFADHQAKLRRDLTRRFGDAALEAPWVGMETESPAAIDRVRTALSAYFKGELDALDSLPRDAWGTPFQRKVWRALSTIPSGETRSYGQIAEQVGAPKAVRAVGLANGRNPISLAVPCHRVIGADGSLTGYGGGMERKRWLLSHERVRGFTGGLPFGE